MEELKSLGLRVDENENLRIMSEETERSSREIVAKAKALTSSRCYDRFYDILIA